MGMFDSVFARCPNCGKQIEFQSKAGECDLSEYNIREVPVEIAADLNHKWNKETCEYCGDSYRLIFLYAPSPVAMNLIKVEDRDE